MLRNAAASSSKLTSTTFNAAFFSGLQLDQWQAHSFYISRYPQGREATLSYPALDVVFEIGESGRAERVLRREGDRWLAQLADGELRADAVVLASPSWVSGALLRPYVPQASEMLESIPHAAVNAVHASASQLNSRRETAPPSAFSGGFAGGAAAFGGAAAAGRAGGALGVSLDAMAILDPKMDVIVK